MKLNQKQILLFGATLATVMVFCANQALKTLSVFANSTAANSHLQGRADNGNFAD